MPFRVMVVEDNAGDVFLLEESLRSYQLEYTLLHFEDSQDAVQWLEQSAASESSPDVVVLDLNTPRGDGFQVLRSIRRTPHMAAVPVVVMSSSEFRKDQSEAESLGADCFIQKPIRLEDFIREIGSAVRGLLMRSRSAEQA